MSILESVHPSLQPSGIIVSPDFAATLGDRQSTALAHTAYEVLRTPLGQNVLIAVEAHKDTTDADERYAQIHEHFVKLGVNLEAHTEDIMIALAQLFVNGTVSVQVDPNRVASPTLNAQQEDRMNYATGVTLNTADQQQKHLDGDPVKTKQVPEQRDGTFGGDKVDENTGEVKKGDDKTGKPQGGK